MRVGLALFLLTVLQTLAVGFINPPCTVRAAASWFLSGGRGRVHDLRGRWRPLERISPHLRRAVLAGEDQRFLQHHGFDLRELLDALGDLVSGRGRRGASTISMQVARTVFLWPERTWPRKLAEAYYTVLIESLWNKARILEVYLNTVDWGTRIVGAESAARTYFRVSCGRVSRLEAALLAAVLPNPHRWSPRRPNGRVLMRLRKILRDMDKMPLVS
ncbi:MAG: monofunctional biosynthetic peptidoglycan transglycosylase [Deltaproteobacteria bacterium]|nr:monofunctional biosynthetic peptidoglycan transglycosylase [Deltaproteobacteria bacterium]MBW1949097.1 monofunctional biosynthetic peptidoglycan transglycosylase [Deltaproteobacteria bacterium]MBW2347849.1 monofunctional biosynthetic peptidoglycan transglycosylase [Deltaproteobacteria bacterium]